MNAGILTEDRVKILDALSNLIPGKTDRRAVLDRILARFSPSVLKHSFARIGSVSSHKLTSSTAGKAPGRD
jgi:hypothetical protein